MMIRTLLFIGFVSFVTFVTSTSLFVDSEEGEDTVSFLSAFFILSKKPNKSSHEKMKNGCWSKNWFVDREPKNVILKWS